MRNLLLVFLVLTLVFPAINQAIAANIEFESFEAAESAAQKRATEYKQKMDEHMKNIQQEWEEQQRDLGSDGSNPDITKITSRSDGQKSSDTDAADNMANAVNSSVNNLKETMISTAGPNSTGFAGGGAGYQWSVKYVGGKYVLSDSYNEADFNTGKKKDKPAPTTPKPEPKANQGSDDKQTVIAKAPDKPAATTTPAGSNPADAKSEPTPATVGSTPGTPSSSATNSGTSTPADPGSSSSSSASTPANEPAVAPANPTKGTSPAPTVPGMDPAPANLPPPAVRLVIQHPTDFSEEVFSSNTDKQDSTSYDLEKFKIPEDTRVKIAVEVSKDINPEDVTLVIVDEEGERAPVTAAKMGNYRHMFRVPSDGNYSANVYVTDKDKPGNRQKKLMQVKIPVTKVDFDSRTIDNQRGTKSSDGSSSSSMSSTSSSGSSSGFQHSSQGRSQQVDLSDLYSDPRQSSANSSGNAGSTGSTAAAGSPGSSSGSSPSGSSGAASSGGSTAQAGGSSDSSSGYASSQSGNSAQGYSADGSADDSSSNSSQSSSGQSTGNYSNENGADSANANAAANAGTGSQYGDSSAGDSSGRDSQDNASYGSSGDTAGQAGGAEGDYRAGGASNAGSSGDYAGSGNSDSGYVNGDNTNSSADESDLPDNQYASAQGLSSSSSSSSGKDSGSSASGAANTKAGDIPEEEPVEDNFIMSVGLRSEAHKIYQSFDFAEDPNQKSTTLPAGSEIVFNIVLGKQVDFESVSIQMADGGEVFGGNLRTMGEAFAYSFKNPSPDSYIQISGKSGKVPFTYRLVTPVAAK
ncbi:MAG: hypothetical protein CVV41_04800 [Candidatus Riflebacteria bacterium HGW-Riflebacteria-1]|jgi:hypothetical protein|nr:MAG: hypothetical protein CVV41_04800 [Candidatus Riflebacteria bacterium HGW-Riflebacteria-1]